MKKPQQVLQLETPNSIITREDCNSPLLAIKFARERHSIYLKRAQGLPKPWTKDQFLSSYRFCNTYRLLDTVSQWIYRNVTVPFEDDPSLWYKLCVCRAINHVDTLQEILDKNAWKDPDKMYKLMKARRDAGLQVFTGAYLINSVFPRDHTGPREKTWFVSHSTLGLLLANRKSVQPHMKESVEAAVKALMTNRGWGAFTSYQVGVDLTYSDKWLKNAPDLNTYNSPGPGTKRGLMRMFGGGTRGAFEKQSEEWFLEKILELHDLFQKPKYWKITSDDPAKGYAKVDLSDVSSSCCEGDKLARLFLNEGAPRSRYPGN